MPFSRFYSFEEIGDVFRGAWLSFDPHGRLAVTHDGSYRVLNDEAWTSIAIDAPDGLKVQHVVEDRDGRRYYGSLGSCGVLVVKDGALRAEAILTGKAPRWVRGNTFSQIIPASEGVYFAGRNGIAFWNRTNGQATLLELGGISHIFRREKTWYVSTFSGGTFRLNPEAGSVESLGSHPLAPVVVDNAATFSTGETLLSTVGRRLLLWDSTNLVPVIGPLGGRLEGRVTAMQPLPDGLVAVAVTGKGLYILRSDGQIETALTLPEYRLISSLAAREPGVLWASTEAGIAKILYGSPVTSFGQALGLPVNWPQVLSWQGQTIVASNGRLYEALPGPLGEPTRFKLMDPQPSSGAWGLATDGRFLLAANSTGVFAKEPGQAFQTVLPEMNVARLLMLGSGECLVIGEKQIAALRWEAGRWQECAPRVPGVGFPSVVRASRNAAWVEIGANHAVRIKVQAGEIKVRQFDSYPWNDPRWINVSIVEDVAILSGPASGRIYFDETREQLVEDPPVKALLQRMPYWPVRIRVDEAGIWWVSHPHGLFTFDPAAKAGADTETYRVVHEHAPLVYVLPGRNVWASNGRTLLHVKPGGEAKGPGLLQPRLVSARDLRSGRELIEDGNSGWDAPRLSYGENSLSLQFFAGTYALRPAPGYEYRINEGAWSSLDASSALRLTDLREGAYRVDVRLVDPRGPFGDTMSYGFEIAPPWFRTPYAYGAYALLAGVVFVGAVQLSLRRAATRNAELERLVDDRTAELRATMAKLETETQTAATLAERNRLAGEIHDSLEQGFAGLAVQLAATAKFPSCPPEVKGGLAVALNMLGYSRNEVRHAVQNLHSPVLDSLDLEGALRHMVAQVSATPGSVTVVREGAPCRLGSTAEHHLLRIAQEAVTNAIKHASAKRINVALTFRESEVQLKIEDDGCGFDPAVVLGGDFGHFGLPSFKGRANKIGGAVVITSRPGAGTRIVVRVPLSC